MDRQKLIRAIAAEYIRRKWERGTPAAHWDAAGIWWPGEPAINPCCIPLRASRDSLRQHWKTAKHLVHLVSNIGEVSRAEVLREARALESEMELRRLTQEVEHTLEPRPWDVPSET